MFKRLMFCALLAAGPAAATREYMLPTLFDVEGVAADDVLNIRARPDASAEIIGTFAPDATGIEIVASEGNWGQVNTGESAGWVSMRYLRYRTDVWTEGALPDGFRCGGTEPFWSLEPRDEGLIWWTPEGETMFDTLEVLDSGVFRSPRRALMGSGEGGEIWASVTDKQCSDGMSDRRYGLEASVILQGETSQLYTGCCQITPAN
ncbi:COG3650 family protein [Paracoccus sediminicola]|uniref:COG3650 family protein n=1 Tax=Paracoccus sediminicola TaxID=3017783 RepID=UPI0022F0A256|nr:SH3 domain-containing protein [Paracoccus sediminicola]WBU56862.1 SH3 domain-containing protein [Paracoccus sediminicola]